MAWNLEGHLTESCSCNVLCPCWYGVQDLMKMDKGWCAGTLLVRIAKGSSGGEDLAGRDVVVSVDWPGPTLLDGKGTGRVHIDDGASADQKQELEAIFQGTRGGPMEILGGLITKWLPTATVKIDIQAANGSLSAQVGEFGRITSEPLNDEQGRPMTVSNAGFATAFNFDNHTFQIAPSGTQWKDPELPHQFETRSGAAASLRWDIS